MIEDKHSQHTAPVESKDEDRERSDEEKGANPVEAKEELLGRHTLMQHVERWWVVEEVEQQDRDDVHRSQEVEAVAPLARSLLHSEGHNRCQRAGWRRHEISVPISHVPPFHRHDLGHNPEEGELAGSSDADKDLCADECVDILGLRSNDRPEQRQRRTADEEPATTEDIRQAADE